MGSDAQYEISSVADIGQAIRRARKSQGLTQQDFADIVGVGVRFLSELENGKRTAEVGLVLDVLAAAGFELVLTGRGWSTPAPEASQPGNHE
jgi:HTH-type transcriptional regulator/antitoxin HipB